MLLVYIGLLYILLSLLGRRYYNPTIGLFIIFFVMAFQSGVHGDYDGYKESYNCISIGGILNRSHVEIGWLLLNQFFSHNVSFEVFIVVISFIQYIILRKFVEEFADNKFLFLCGLIFYFSLNLMLFQMKGLRQALAIDLSLYALMRLRSGNLIYQTCLSIVMIYLLSFIHGSALIALVPILVYSILTRLPSLTFLLEKYELSHKLPIIITSLYIIIYLSKEVLFDIIVPLLFEMNLGGKEGYFGELVVVDYNILITLFGVITVYATSYVLQAQIGFQKFLFYIALVSLFMEMFTFGAGNLFRLTLYYGIVQVVVLPNVCSFLYYNHHKKLAWAFAALIILYHFRSFITQTTRNLDDAFDNYTFIFI